MTVFPPGILPLIPKIQLSMLLSGHFKILVEFVSLPTFIIFLNIRVNVIPITLSYLEIGSLMALIFIYPSVIDIIDIKFLLVT